MMIAPLQRTGYYRVERMVLSGFFGMMFIISCFFLILYFAIRGKQYIYFSLYILSLGVFLFITAGYLGEFFWRENSFLAEILGQLRAKVKEMLVQQGSIHDQKDGMDMAIAILDKEKRELQFAGANNPLYLIRNREQLNGDEFDSGATVETDNSLLFELKGDKQPIGIHWEETDFTSHLIKLQEYDTIYLFSDGYVDQYGGENRKKFKTPRFKELLLSVQAESMDRQKQLIDNAFESWRGNIEQIDDVCVIGLRV